MTIELVRTVNEVRALSRAASREQKTVALVPTMGGLHEGHLALVKKAEEIADLVIVSLFVNPTQFNNPSDLETYPGNEEDDLAALEKTGTHVLFAPGVDEMYPEGFATNITVTAANGILCDAHRPGHFAGVATVVSKLLLQSEPDFACFGEKDFQQLFIIRRMVKDLNIPTEIVPCETVREKDGLALSSRNSRLSTSDRENAPSLNLIMRNTAEKILNKQRPDKICVDAKTELEKSGVFDVEYFEYRSGDSLQKLSEFSPDGRLFAAAWLGGVRLIDNIAVCPFAKANFSIKRLPEKRD